METVASLRVADQGLPRGSFAKSDAAGSLPFLLPETLLASVRLLLLRTAGPDNTCELLATTRNETISTNQSRLCPPGTPVNKDFRSTRLPPGSGLQYCSGHSEAARVRGRRGTLLPASLVGGRAASTRAKSIGPKGSQPLKRINLRGLRWRLTMAGSPRRGARCVSQPLRPPC